MKVLVFDIWGKFGHFKKFYTTASPLTFSVPPPTAIYGMIGAILGFEKDDYLNYLNKKTTKVAIQIINPIKKSRYTYNYIDTKNSNSFHLIKNRTQIKIEFLKNPKYRFYINISDNDIFDKLIKMVKNKESFYTLSLGLANLLANFKFVGLYDANFIGKSEYIDSVILADNIEKINVKEGYRYFKEKLPMDMNVDRETLSYKDVVMELNGQRMEGLFKDSYSINNSIISLL